MESECVSVHKRGGKKKVKDFELTLARSSLEKTHVFFALAEFCELLVVSQERHNEDGELFLQHSYHFHCYLRLFEPSRIVELRGIIGINLFGDEGETWESIHISTLRNAKHWIKYITKEDPYPMCKNMDTGMFHQSYKIHKFVRDNPEFDTLHPFCRQNPSLINILRRTTHEDYWNKKTLSQHALAVSQRKVRPAYHVSWVLRVVSALGLRQHIYLYGETGLGKSVLLTHYALTHRTVWLPCGNTPWEFGKCENNTTLAIAGDAPAGYFDSHRSTILRLCDRDPISLNVKSGGFKEIVFKGSLVIISNYGPPLDPAFSRRFTVIEADSDGFLQEKDEEEIIEIPPSPSDTAIWLSSDEENSTESDVF